MQSVIKIGIPRSLFYYKFISLWEVFFAELGAEVIVSDPTNKRILDDGVRACVDEACLPVKLFHGHVMNLIGRVDYIFIPRFTSISKKEYICPEFGGLPDMVRHTLKGLPELIDTEINMRNSKKGAVKAAIETGIRLGAGKRASQAAFIKAMGSYKDFRRRELDGDIPFVAKTDKVGSRNTVQNEGWDKEGGSERTVPLSVSTVLPSLTPRDKKTVPLFERTVSLFAAHGKATVSTDRLRIALIGHPYNIYDRYISMNMIEKLNNYGAEIETIEMVSISDKECQTSGLSKPMFWYYGRKAYGAALHMAASGRIDGMICLSSFGCGIDSFVHDLIERKIRKEYQIPFISITIDEHSGEAGFNTRLEAFIDMLCWRRLNDNNVSSSG